ncbi:hypothetical protein BC937DRAFT_89410 [Endogone sp. FLAS-F59071]|nr:hypothetical protein BC937DRAFT_89410 [Endogone sp. FLAS-F59071]|eukprot:RUS17853.1 hypothetical protein BC937DRAFT_89410 [Endogone sp. FLAS-F59071]
MDNDYDSNRQKANHAIRCAVLSRLLILQYCTKSPLFNPQRWLLLQVCHEVFQEQCSFPIEDIFSTLTQQLIDCHRIDIDNAIRSTYPALRDQLRFIVFPIILDEAQALCNILPKSFLSTANPS